MCGIVGYVTNERLKGAMARDKYLEQGIAVDYLRGAHSTGIYTVDHDNKIGGRADWFKTLDSGPDFVRRKEFSDIINRSDEYGFAVAHNRFATMGGINVDTAHPFQEGAITLVHNGTLKSTYDLPTPMYELDGVVVDSHAICHNLNTHDVADVIVALDGAFTLIWHDARDNCLRIIRNTQRPLHLAQCKHQDTVLFGSEGGMVNWLSERNGLATHDIVEPDAGTLVTIPLGDVTNMEMEDLELYTPPKHYGGYSRGYSDYGTPAGYSGYKPPRVTNRAPLRAAGMVPNPRVFVGGRMQDIPAIAQEDLMDCGLVVEEILRYTPTMCTPIKNATGIASGFLPASGLPCLIYDASVELYNMYKGGDWAVRPVAVKFVTTDTGAYEPIIICKVVAYKFLPEYHLRVAGLITAQDVTEDDDWESIDLVGSDLPRYDATPYVGAYGVCYSEELAHKMIQGGCIQCGRGLDLQDWEDLEWVNNFNDPMCIECVVDSTYTSQGAGV